MRNINVILFDSDQGFWSNRVVTLLFEFGVYITHNSTWSLYILLPCGGTKGFLLLFFPHIFSNSPRSCFLSIITFKTQTGSNRMCDKVTASASRSDGAAWICLHHRRLFWTWGQQSCAEEGVGKNDGTVAFFLRNAFQLSIWYPWKHLKLWAKLGCARVCVCVCTVCVCVCVCVWTGLYKMCVDALSLSFSFKRMTRENVWEKKKCVRTFYGVWGIFFFPLCSFLSQKLNQKQAASLPPSVSFPSLSLSYFLTHCKIVLFMRLQFSNHSSSHHKYLWSVFALSSLLQPLLLMLLWFNPSHAGKMNQSKQQQHRSTTRSRQTKTCGKRSSWKYGRHAAAACLLIKSIFM